MSIELIDSHCHLNLSDCFPDPIPYIEEAFLVGVTGIILVGLDPSSGEAAIDLASRYEGVFAVVGRHPNYAGQYKAQELAVYAEMLKHPKVVALGEIGLDYHWEYSSREEQKRCLLDQLDLADDLNVPVVFHCREACPDLLTILENRYGTQSAQLLFHCFSGDENDAKRAEALGCYFGFDGPITYKKSTGLRSLVATLPRDRILIETDSPYLTPEPFRGKPNKPSYLPLINAALAKALSIEPEECGCVTAENTRRFFGL